MRAVDYIIVGQGLAGSCLALELIKRKKKIVVFDSAHPNSASRIAAGLYNPITGRTNQPTWRAGEVFKTLKEFYTDAEERLKVRFLHPLPLYRPFISLGEQGNWPVDSNLWIQKSFNKSRYDSVHDPLGGIEINNSGYLDTSVFLSAVQKFILSHAELIPQSFDYNAVQFTDILQYQEYQADKIIFCEGCEAKLNPWFNWLSIRKLKGELLTVEAKLPQEAIINRGIFSVALSEDTFLVGSTYVHDEQEGNTPEGIEELFQRAKKLFKPDMKIVGQAWGHRPTTIDRRPLLGCNPQHQNICIFNGLGTKGVSLAPFFALHLADWLEGVAVLDKEVNIERFYSLSFKPI